MQSWVESLALSLNHVSLFVLVTVFLFCLELFDLTSVVSNQNLFKICTRNWVRWNGLTHSWKHVFEQVLPANRESPFMYGMLAFALLEVGGRMREAEVAAKKALEIDPLDVWGQHAVRVCCNFHGHCAELWLCSMLLIICFLARLSCQALQ